MNFKAKLSRLSMGRSTQLDDEAVSELPGRDGTLGEHEERIHRLRILIAEATARGSKKRAGRSAQRTRFDAPLPGVLKETPFGAVQVVEEWLEPRHHHGREAVSTALDADPAVVAQLALSPELAEVDLERLLILDTETTGLSTGAGTLPFLVGLAYFDDRCLKVEQLFLRSPGQEAPLLHLLSERIQQASVLLTYNGKTFDWPLLRTRFIMNRVPMPALPPHLDLLHCARRIYKRRLERVRLTQIEEAVLGFHREHDVSGAEIPQLYLEFLRGGDAGPLTGVIEHNANDLIALAAILGKMTRHFERVHRKDDPRDHLGYALLAERTKDASRADDFASAVVLGGADEGTSFLAYMLRSRIARRQKKWAAADAYLAGALKVATGAQACTVHLALSKLCEHKLKDFERALVHCQLAVGSENEEAYERRLKRVHRRLLRARP